MMLFGEQENAPIEKVQEKEPVIESQISEKVE